MMQSAVIARLQVALGAEYKFDRELGAGGMATVYLAHDIKHDRDVAIKVLHPDLGVALGADRFLSEIRTTARLQHPHILPLLDSGDADGLLYYVMPVVTGETLRARLDRERQLPISDAVRIAREVASALDYANRQGVIHRDIKPENILLHDGSALVADFGIALAVQSAGGARMTQTGLSLGTPQYMSPEQAMGEKIIDARSDVYALGAVTYEMLVGDAPFTGSSVQAIVAKVLTERPTPLHTVRDTVPAGVEYAVLTALAKLPADRYATAAEFATALVADRPSFGSSSMSYPISSRRSESARWRVSTTVAWTVALIATIAAAWSWLSPQQLDAPVTRVAIALPQGQELLPAWRGYSIALSKDGSRLAYVGAGPTHNSTQLWIRPLDALQATAVPNTIGATTVRWAPDGRSLLFSNALNTALAAVVSLEGGQVTPAPEAFDGDVGASGRVYTSGQRVITRHTPGGATDTVARLAVRALTLTVMPDERTALVAMPRDSVGMFADAKIVAVSLTSAKSTVIGPGVYAQYLSSGHLLYVSASGDAFVAPFDARDFRIKGPATPVARVALSSNSGRLYPQITASDNGTLAYVSGDVQRHRLTWLDASGRVSQRLTSEGNFWGIAISPDGSRVALSTRQDERLRGSAGGTGDVWVEDLRTGTRTQLTSSDFNVRPSWSADGAYVLYTRVGGPLQQALVERRADAAEPERVVLTRTAFGHSVGDGRWLPDHRTMLVRTYADVRATSRNIFYVLPGSADSTAHPVAATQADEVAPAPSPDGSLVAYNSDESGTMEVYVQPFPSGQGRLQVSRGGGSAPRWSRDGRLYFWDQSNRLIVVTIQSRPTLARTNVREIAAEVFPAVAGGGSTTNFDVAPDGRILIAEPVTGSYQLVLERNWMAVLRGGSTK
ncbi:MAG: protein kinase [Gemmatimonadaceae bacterium]|nr:protein kinase [Gemmatimonadaceae bacterium]